jgi:hypothetical protein
MDNFNNTPLISQNVLTSGSYLPDVDTDPDRKNRMSVYLLMVMLYKGSAWVNAAGLSADVADMELNNAKKQELNKAFNDALGDLSKHLAGDDKAKEQASVDNQKCVAYMQDMQLLSQSNSNITQTQIQTKLADNQANMNMISTCLSSMGQLAVRQG